MSHANKLLDILDRHDRGGQVARVREGTTGHGNTYESVWAMPQPDGSARPATDEEIRSGRTWAESSAVLDGLVGKGLAVRDGQEVRLTDEGRRALAAWRQEQHAKQKAKWPNTQAKLEQALTGGDVKAIRNLRCFAAFLAPASAAWAVGDSELLHAALDAWDRADAAVPDYERWEIVRPAWLTR